MFIRLMLFHGRQLLRIPFFLQQALIAPLAFQCLRAIGMLGSDVGVQGDLWMLSGIAGMWATTTLAVGLIGFQRFQGTLEYLAISTLSPSTVFGSLASSAMVIGLLGFPLTFIAQQITGGEPTLNATQLVGIGGAAIACGVSSWLLAAVFVLFRTARVYEPLILTPVWLLCGVVIPLNILPNWTVAIAVAHPLTWVVLAVEQSNLLGALPLFGVAVLVCVLWSIAAGLALRTALARARVAGTLGLS
ncbi:ABC transporter permease [Gulosibacter sediminis]|uniref:ABC transporter permease n=1 Tax=Gulosibacter sediminis TaxID=1729695 RepID=UPI0024A92307|nr:ABC transporter permease [Gulosibacter sediminis]